jgi:hypothetical protein
LNDADLVAYLDGELDEAAARAVEARLAADPAARRKADAFRRSFALLDALPRPDPPADFTTRTVTRLLPAAGSSTTTQLPTTGRRRWRGPLVVAAVLLAGLLGAAARLAARPSAAPDTPLIADLPVIEALPLYLGVDDLAFVRRLDAPDLFPASGPPTAHPPADPSSEVRERLTALFQGFPAARRRQLRTLHADLTELPPTERDRLTGVLERYAGWLDRLPDAERSRVLAATPGERLAVVEDAVLTTRREALPARKREQLGALRAGERLQLLAEAHAAEQTARADWARAAEQWQQRAVAGAKPWPFDQPSGLAEVDGFVRTVLQADLGGRYDPDGCRLTPAEFADLRARHEAAVKDGYWFLYGLQVWRLADRHPSLPRPRDKPPMLSARDLPDAKPKRPFLTPALEKRQTAGKWPDFAKDVAALLNARKQIAPFSTSVLGPCKPGDFPDAVETVLAELQPLLTDAERKELKKAEGRWPDYPATLVRLAERKDKPVPGVTLPGPPSKWAATYGLR